MYRVAVGFFSFLVLWLSSTTAAFSQLSFTAEETDDGLRYLLVQGVFAFDDDLSQFIRTVRFHNPSVVVFHSTGGNPFGAMALGRQIRAHGLSTLQFRGLECASACSFAFMGGVNRFAEAGSLGVHRSSYTGLSLNASDAVSAVQQHTAEIMSYLVEMGVDPLLMQLAMRYDADDIRYLSRSEMEQYRIVTSSLPSEGLAHTSQAPPQQPQASIAPQVQQGPDLSIPEARTGRVLHPSGQADLKFLPTTDSANVATLMNGSLINIHESRDRWYRVTPGGQSGWLHHTWVFVDQYESGPFGQRHVQIKSFDNFSETEAFIRSSTLPLRAYLATNGWFAVTLDNTYSQDDARELILALKERDRIPSDSVMTYGNTYARKVCC